MFSAGQLAGMGASMLGDIYQGEQNRKQANEHSDKQERLQREFAQSGIQWRVEDAKKAGISPLAALGAGGASYSPANFTPDNTYSNMGQNINRALSATSTQAQREMTQLNLESARLDNEMKKTELAKMKQTGPPMPSTATNFMPGQGNSDGLMKVNPAERSASQPGRPAQEAGWKPDVGYARTDTGLTPVIPKDLAESLEDDFVGKTMWRIRNQFLPNFGEADKGAPPRDQLPNPARQVWKWNYWKQEWQPHTWDKR